MALILQVRADPNNIFKVNHFKNTGNWIVHGTPTYSNIIFPNQWEDSFFLNGSSWIESPADDTFNFYQKEFTITWWEYCLGDINTGETGSINFVTNSSPPNHTNSYFLLHYKASTTSSFCYAHNTANATGWNIFSELSTGRPANELNTWNNFALTSKIINGVHTFNTYKNGIKIATKTSSLTFPNIGNVGKLVIGAYGQDYIGCNRHFQNIKIYNECLFDGVSSYDVQKYERWDHSSSRLINDLKTDE